MEALERANKAMHESQDQVKAFKSKLMMCDAMQERELQLQLKKKKQEMEKEVER